MLRETHWVVVTHDENAVPELHRWTTVEQRAVDAARELRNAGHRASVYACRHVVTFKPAKYPDGSGQ